MHPVRSLRAALLAGVLILYAAAPSRAQSAPYLARTWDSTITIPPGGYRSEKPIQLKNSINITTSPWTTIDSVVFQGVQNDQHWHLDGTIMRRVSLNGQLGVAMTARNSVFENCDLSKTGGWFVSWWGSHWKFENCIFTGKFMHGDIPPGDYEVHAVQCTFYDIKLPTIGIRDDPTYLQKDHMAFVKCHFVRCDVPETFLAATVDCVFEDCHFPGKRQAWPAEMTPLKVNAMYSGLSDAPESFLNGPLSVKFTEAPEISGAGSTLRHSQTGDEIALNNYSPPMEFVNFGTMQGSSSQVVPAADSGDSFARPASSGPAGDSVTSFDDLIRKLPANINLITNDQPDPDGIDAANKWLASNFNGKTAAMQIQYGSGKATNDSGAGYEVLSAGGSLLYRGNTLATQAITLFPAANTAPLAQISRGSEMNIRGSIKSAEIQGRGQGLTVVLTIANASLQ